MSPEKKRTGRRGFLATLTGAVAVSKLVAASSHPAEKTVRIAQFDAAGNRKTLATQIGSTDDLVNYYAYSDLNQLLTYPFMVNALWAGTIVAILAALVGWFAVTSAPSVTEERPVRPLIGEYTFV